MMTKLLASHNCNADMETLACKHSYGDSSPCCLMAIRQHTRVELLIEQIYSLHKRVIQDTTTAFTCLHLNAKHLLWGASSQRFPNNATLGTKTLTRGLLEDIYSQNYHPVVVIRMLLLIFWNRDCL